MNYINFIKKIGVLLLLILLKSNLIFASITSDSTTVSKLIEKAQRALELKKSDSAIFYASNATDLAREYAFIESQAVSSLIIAKANKQKNLTGSALKYYLQSKKLYEQLPITFSLGKLYYELGSLYEVWGLDKKAQEYYVKSHPIYNAYSDKPTLNRLTRRIGDIYYRINSYENALMFYQRLYDEYKTDNNKTKMLEILQIMSDIGRKTEDYEKAVGYQLQILGISQWEDDTLGMMNAFYKVASLYKEEYQYNKALEYFQKYLNLTAPASTPEHEQRMVYQYIEAMNSIGLIYEEWGAEEGDAEYLKNSLAYYSVVLNVIESLEVKDSKYHNRLAQTYLNVARTYKYLTDYKNTVFYCHKSLENMRVHKNLEILSETYELLVYSLRKLRKFRSSLRYYDKQVAIQDSLSEQELNERKDKILSQVKENKRQVMINKTEQIIINQELDSLTILQLELAAERREQELEILMAEREIQNITIANEQLQKDKAMQDLLLTLKQLNVEKKERQISQLTQKQVIQSMQLKQQELERKEKERKIQLLEKDKEIKGLELDTASKEKSNYRVGIILISIILILIFANLLIARRANRKLAFQNAKIEQQAQNLREANINIQNQNSLIAEKNKELVQLNKEKNHIIGIIAHDLRNPLSVSMSLIDFVGMKKEYLNEDQIEGLGIIRRSMHRMNDMITKILDVRAIESNKLNVKLEPVDLLEITNHIINSFESRAQGKNILLRSSGNIDSAYVQADEQYLTQVLENLVSNALKFSAKDSFVDLLIEQDEFNLKIGVRDYGPGLTKEDHSKLFGKFQKLSAKPTAGEQSTGLGLSIVKKYVNLMKGNVWCESQLGEGATFWVTLPKGKLVEV